MSIEITSSAFEEGGSIPQRHTCQGDDVSPPLSWSGVPDDAETLALICDDPDAPGGTWVHWVLYDLPVDASGLPEGVPAEEVTSEGARQGTNDFQRIGYGGPCPPAGGAHRYYFKLYALDGSVDLEPGATKAELLDALAGRIVAQGQLMGRYARS